MSMYLGDIFSATDSTSLPVGIPQETPLHKKWRRRCKPKQPTLPLSKSKSRKRKSMPNVSDPPEEKIMNYGSDADSDSDGECEVLECMQSPRSDRVMMDLLDEVVTPADPTDPLPSTSTDLESSSSTSCDRTKNTFGPHFLTDFVWKASPIPPVPPQQRREKFTAPVGPVSSYKSPYESFVAIWDRSIMEHIAAETNRYANQVLETALSQGNLGGYSRKLKFEDTNADELYVFFAVIVATGLVVKADLTEYWSVNDDILDTPNFSRYMTYTRFIGIAQMLHFVNNEEVSHLPQSGAKIAKIAPIVQHLNEKFQALYQLGQCIALDESLTQWKGWLSINQFIKSKAAAQGVKTYEVCDSTSGYLWRFKVHAGRKNEEKEHKNEDKDLGYITSLVLDLLTGLENKGHTVFMDNFYNSPLLARILKSHGFDCVGTLRLSRQHVPVVLKNLNNQSVPVGSVHGATSGDVDVLVWRDKKLVAMISTYHGAASASRDGTARPTVIHDYNVRMGGVDKKDQMLSSFPIERKRTAVWYKKFFRRLLNASVLNAYILFREGSAPHPRPESVKHRQYRKKLVTEILEAHGQRRCVLLKPLPSQTKVKFSKEMMRHFPREYPFNENLKQRKRGCCGICRKRTQTHCVGCNVALCLDPCFIEHHT